MNYQLKPIEGAVHDAFLNGHPKEHFMQTSIWGDIKSMGAWKKEIVGLFDDSGKLVASTLLLRRSLPVIKKPMYYAPRGFIIDFDNQELLAAFTQELRRYITDKGAVYLIVDPDRHYRETDANDKVIKEADDFVERMQSLGYQHRGFNMNFEATQPRFTFRLYLKGNSVEEVFDRFDRFTRKAIRLSQEHGIEATPSDDIDLFCNIMHETAIRDQFIENPKSYYQAVFTKLKEKNMADMYVSTYYPRKHLALIEAQMKKSEGQIQEISGKIAAKDTPKLQNQLKQQQMMKERLEREAKEAQELLLKYPDGIALSAGIDINTEHRGWTVYGGSRSVLRELNANYSITYEAICEYFNRGMEFMDFFGTIGNPDENNPLYGIHRFKKKFSGTCVEFPGEFHLVINQPLYHAWVKLYPAALSFCKKTRKLLRKS